MDDEKNSPESVESSNVGSSDNLNPEVQCVATELDELRRACTESNDRYLRLAADFENFRKRTARDREATIALANEKIAADFLEVVDNIERALKTDDAHLREGVSQIRQMMCTILERHGITPIVSLEKKFNPSEHEAIAHVPSEKEDGIVIDEVARGYRMHDKVIRYAKVAVSKGKENNQEA